MWNIRNSMEDIRRRKGKMKGETNHERLWTPRNKQDFRWEEVGSWVGPVMGNKDGTDCMEHWVLCVNNDPWNTTSKTNDVLYGDLT